jgi:RecA-family ATPase
MTRITSQDITNLYLYGTKTTPIDKISDSLIRQPEVAPKATALTSVTIDGQTHMFFGAGRFAYASQFEIGSYA